MLLQHVSPYAAHSFTIKCNNYCVLVPYLDFLSISACIRFTESTPIRVKRKRSLPYINVHTCRVWIGQGDEESCESRIIVSVNTLAIPMFRSEHEMCHFRQPQNMKI